MINYNVILPTSFRKEAALRVRTDRNPILSISSKLRRLSFAMTIDRPAPTLQSSQPSRGQRKKYRKEKRLRVQYLNSLSLDIPSLNRSTSGRPTNPNCTAAAEKERTDEREGRKAAAAAAAGCSRSRSRCVGGVVRSPPRRPSITDRSFTSRMFHFSAAAAVGISLFRAR